MRGILAETPSEIVAEDPCKVRNRANYQRLEKLSADLLAQAIATMKTATIEDCELLELRCANWGDEKVEIRAYLEGNVDPDNWELVRFEEPKIKEKWTGLCAYKPAKPDSHADSWPDEKRALWRFVMDTVTVENRHLVKLLDYEDLRAIKEKRRPRIVG